MELLRIVVFSNRVPPLIKSKERNGCGLQRSAASFCSKLLFMHLTHVRNLGDMR